MKRLILIYNPYSSRFLEVKKTIFSQLKNLNDFIVDKYEIEKTNFDDNVKNVIELLKDGDFVVTAGGDATAAIAVNAILKSQKDVTLSVLPYGNFNDLSRTLGTKTLNDTLSSKKIKNFYPLEIFVDDNFYRYATCYVTIGMTAEAVKIYDYPKVRKSLKSKTGRSVGSYLILMSWYFKNRHSKVFLPEFKLNGELKHKDTSDYAAVNGRYMARVMKGGEDFLKPKVFRSETDRLASFYRLFKLMLKSILKRIPGSDTKGDILEFTSPATFELQAEGEFKTFENVKKVEIKKAEQCLKVVTF